MEQTSALSSRYNHSKIFQKTAIITPSKIIVAELLKCFKLKRSKNPHEHQTKLRIFSYSELDKNLDIFCNISNKKNIIPSLALSKTYNILSEFQILTLLEQIIKNIIVDNQDKNADLTAFAKKIPATHKINSILHALYEYYHHNIDLSLLEHSFDIHENLLYQIIVKFDRLLQTSNTSIKAKHIRCVSDDISHIITGLSNPLQWKIHCILPSIIIPYIQNFIISLHKYFNNIQSTNNKGTLSGSIILHGLNTQCSDNKWAKINSYHQQYVIKTLLDSMSISRGYVKSISCNTVLDEEIHELFIPDIEDNIKSLPNTSMLNFSILSHKNRNSELHSIAEEVLKYSSQYNESSVCIVAPNAQDCDLLYHYLKQKFYEYDKKNKTNIAKKLSSYIPYYLADTSILPHLLLETLEYLIVLFHTSTTLQKIAECFFALIRHPKTFFYNRYGCEIHDLEALVYHRILRGENIGTIISKFANSTLKEIDNNHEEHKRQKLQRRYEFLEHCEILNLRLAELDEFIYSTDNKYKIVFFHLTFIEYLLGDDINKCDQEDIDKIKSLLQKGETEYSHMLIDYNVLIEAQGVGQYKTFLYNILHTRQCYRDNVFSACIKICTPADVLFCRYDLLIATHMEEGKFPRIYKNHGFISENTKKCSQKKNYHNIANLEMGYAATSFANFLLSKKVIFTYSGTDDQNAIRNRWIELLTAYMKLRKLNYTIEHISIKDQIPITSSTNNHIIMKNATTKKITNQHEEFCAPNPSIKQRPLILSTTAIEKLIINPYVFFIEYIIDIIPHKKDHNTNGRQREFGLFLHKILQILSQNDVLSLQYKYDGMLLQSLTQTKIKALKEFGWEKSLIPQYPFWEYKLEKIIQWLYSHETSETYKDGVCEQKISCSIALNNLDIKDRYITCTAILDKFYLNDSGIQKIIDYKSGKLPSVHDITSGQKPQLALQALLLWKNIEKPNTNFQIDASYIQLLGKKNNIAKEISYIFNIHNVEKQLLKILKSFYIDLQPYKPTKKFFDKSYIHLARNTDVIS